VNASRSRRESILGEGKQSSATYRVTMKLLSLRILSTAAILAAAVSAGSQTCQTRDETPAEIKSGMETAAKQAYDRAAAGDVAALQANAIPSLQSSFNGVAAAVNDNKPAFAGARPQLRTSFFIDNGPTASSDGRFYCGVFGASGLGANTAEFDIPGLPAGKYGIVIQDFVGNKGPYSLTTIFQDISGWKLAGFYVRPESALGHDGIWYLQHAREYKAKGQNHNAWFYYVTSWQLLAPVEFMDSSVLSKITQESGGIQPKDIPAGNPVNFSANGKTFSITDMSVFRTDTTFDLSVRYSAPSTADFNATQAEARGLANALVAQYPELKDAFNNVWVHAVGPSGADVVGLVNLKPAVKNE
jgi:hypothetical protein